MAFQSLEEINEFCEDNKIPFWQAILLDDIEERMVTRAQSYQVMEEIWEAMLEAGESYEPDIVSGSGLVGKMGATMDAYRKKGDTLCGDFVSQVITQALQMGESNACMKRIVAAPTAGACGVLPAVLIPYYNNFHASKDKMVEALYVSAGIGQVIASRAFIAGAAGGCQAEIGSAAAMAAGTLVYLKGGDNNQILHAVAMSLKNLLGLVCDPVAGLVEIPCIKRNVIGAVNALSAADMALAGITSRIPADQVIDAMKEVGESMHRSLKETAKGGLANTPEGRKIREQLGI